MDSTDNPSRRLLKNAGLILLSRLAGIITLLVTVPFVIAHLGASGFGVWEALLAIAGMVMVFQAVISGTILWQSSICFATKNHERTQRLVRTGIGATLLLAIVAFSVVWHLRAHACEFLQIPAEFKQEALWLLPAIVGLMLLGGINETLASVVSGYQRSGLASLVQSLGLVATNLFAIVGLVLGLGLPALLMGYAVGLIAQLVALYPLASSCCGRLSLLPTSPTSVELAGMGKFAALVLLSNLTLLARDQSDRLILSSLESPLLAGYFSMAHRIASLVMQVCVVFYAPFTAALGALHSQGDWPGVCNLYGRISGWINALAGIAVILICSLRKPLFVLWVGSDVPQCHSMLVLLMIGTGSAVILTSSGVALCKAIGRPGLETAYLLLTLLLTLLTKPILVSTFGAMGSVVSSAGSWCIGSLLFVVLLHMQVRLPRQVLKSTVVLFAVTFCVSALGWLVAGLVEEPQTRTSAALQLTGLGISLSAAYFWLLRCSGLLSVELPLQRAWRRSTKATADVTQLIGKPHFSRRPIESLNRQGLKQ